MRIKIALFITGLILSLQSLAVQMDRAALEQQCRNITPQQRQMAKAAGYDVDSVCSSLKGLSKRDSSDSSNRETVLPRGSQVTIDDRGVIREQNATSENATLTQKNINRKNQREKGLKRYGYDLFAGVPTTFAPATDIPVPVEYVVGPGDNFQIQLLGKVSDSYELRVDRNGSISFPELGPIAVTGLKFSEARQLIQQKIKEQMIGVRAVVSLGELRSIRVFVLGEAFKPGSYTVSSLSTMTNALFASGGITEIGSLRNIQLKRRGEVISSLDLYQLLQQGDTSNDVRLLPGDVIYIPPVGTTVGIRGEVKRPAIYELKNEKTLQHLIKLAGGYSSSAYPNISHITRKNKSGFTSVIDLDLSKPLSKNTTLENGDLVEVSTVLEQLEDVIKLSGSFHRPRALEWFEGIKLKDVIHSIKDFNENTDLNIGLIVRKEMPLRQISVLHFNLQNVIERKKDSNVLLLPMDEIITFNSYQEKKKTTFEQELQESASLQRRLEKIENFELEKDKKIIETGEQSKDREELVELIKEENIRSKALESIIKRLKEQTSNGGLIKIVDISGNVRFPGSFPLTEGMTVRDLILLAGGLKEASYLGNAEVTRRDLSNQESATIKHIDVDLAKQLIGEESFVLNPKDKLAIYATPEYREHLTIVLEGEVRFPRII